MSNKAGLFLCGQYKGIVTSTRKDDKGNERVIHRAELLVSTDQGSFIYRVNVKSADYFAKIEKDTHVSVPVYARSFKDQVFYTLAVD